MSKMIQCGKTPKHIIRALAKRKNGKIIHWSAYCKDCNMATVVLTKHSAQYKVLTENPTT